MRASVSMLSLLVLLPGCPDPVPLSGCPDLGSTSDWTGNDSVIACEDGALSLALSGTAPLVADGQATVQVSLRVGRDFVLVGVPITLTAANGVFISGAGGVTLDLLTDAEGKASATLRVGVTPGPLIVSGEVKAQPGALDAGTGQARTTVFAPLGSASIKALLITTAAPRIAAGASTSLSVSGSFDDAMQIPAVNARVEVCLDGGQMVATPSTLVLGDGGVASTSLAVSSGAPPGQVQVRVCPTGTNCAASACRDQTVEIEAARKPILRAILSVPEEPIVTAQSVTVNVAGYSSIDFLIPAADKSAVALCASGGSLQDTWLQLDASGKASTRFVAGTSGSVTLGACPYGLDCMMALRDAGFDERCFRLERPVGPAPDAISSMALSLGTPLRRNLASTLTVAAYADSRRLVPSKPGVSVRLCLDSQHVEAPSALFLEANGRASAAIIPRQDLDAGPMADGGTAEDAGWPWGPVVLTACPYEVQCATPTAVCETLDAGQPQ